MSGRSYCAAAESYECEAPAGIGTFSGYAEMPGVYRDTLLTCAYCYQPVCRACSEEMIAPSFMRKRKPVRVCTTHQANELTGWKKVTK